MDCETNLKFLARKPERHQSYPARGIEISLHSKDSDQLPPSALHSADWVFQQRS